MTETPFVHMLKTPRGHYCYDVNTNQIIRVNEGVYEYLEALEQGREPGEPAPQVQHKLDQLRGRGLLKTKRPKKMRHPATDDVEYMLTYDLEFMSLQVTQNCNFRCDYCAYASGDFELTRTHSPKSMSWETAKKAIDFLVQHSDDKKLVGVGFYGGEPLMSYPLIKKAILYVEDVLKGKNIQFNITTNGSLLTDEVMAFFQEHDMNVLVSLDGEPCNHDRSRRFASNGRGTFSVIKERMTRMRENYPKLFVRTNVNTVVDARFPQEELYSWFDENEPFSELPSVRTTLIDDMYSLMRSEVSEEYRQSYSVLMFKAIMAELEHYPREKVPTIVKSNLKTMLTGFTINSGIVPEIPDETSHGGPCVPGKSRLLVNVDGAFYPCERVSETSPAMVIGNVDDGFDFDNIKRLLNIAALTEEQCVNCWAITRCTQCARGCDNCGELSPDMKLSFCKTVKDNVEEDMLNYIFSQEYNIIA